MPVARPVGAAPLARLLASAKSFSGSLPQRLLNQLNKHGGLRLGPSEALSVTLASGSRPGGSGPGQVSLRPVLQAGLLLSGF